MLTVTIERGTFPLPWPPKARVDFAIFPGAWGEFPTADPYVIQSTVPLGNLLVYHTWNLEHDQIGRTPDIWGVELPLDVPIIPPGMKSPVQIRFVDADAERIRSIRRHIAMRRCTECGRPTRYMIRVVRSITPAFLGGYGDITESSVCMRHLNGEIFQLSAFQVPWTVYRWDTRYRLGSRYRETLGTVLHDRKTGEFKLYDSIPELPVEYFPDAPIIFRLGGQEVARLYLHEGACLALMRQDDYDAVMRKYRLYLERGVPINKIGEWLNYRSITDFPIDIKVRHVVMGDYRRPLDVLHTDSEDDDDDE